MEERRKEGSSDRRKEGWMEEGKKDLAFWLTENGKCIYFDRGQLKQFK